MYSDFSQVYDLLMSDFDYDAYADDLLGLVPDSKRLERICEGGCGTGKVTLALLKKTKAQIVAFDLSQEMLVMASNRLMASNRVTLLRGDVRSFQSPYPFDLYLTTLDTLNYLIDDGDLLKAFKSARALLKKGATFVFDINTPYKLQVIQGSETYVYDSQGIFYVWINEMDTEKETVDYHIDFFIEEEGFYRRITEKQTERWYTMESIRAFLKESGFEVIQCLEKVAPDEPFGPPARWIFSARAI